MDFLTIDEFCEDDTPTAANPPWVKWTVRRNGIPVACFSDRDDATKFIKANLKTICVNAVLAEGVQLFGPSLYGRNPVRGNAQDAKLISDAPDGSFAIVFDWRGEIPCDCQPDIVIDNSKKG